MASIRRIVLCLSFVVLALQPARAEEPPIIKQMLDGIEQRIHIRPTYQSIDQSGDTITIKGFAFKFAEGLDFEYGVETLTLTGIAETGEARYEVTSVDASGLSFLMGGQMVVAIPSIRSSGIFIRGLPQNPTDVDKFLAGSSLARSMTIPEIVVLVAEKSLRVENIEATFEGDPWAYNGTQRMKVGRLAVPEDILAMAGDDLPLKQLGYTALEFSSDSTLQFDLSGEVLSMGFDMGFTGKDMGTVHMVANVADIPMALAQAVSEQPQPDENKIMELASGISLSNIKLGFVDGSLTDRLIDFFATTQNMDRTQLIATAAASVQLALTDLKNQDFTNKVIAAVNSFLASPISLYVLAAAAPVKVEQLMQAGEDPVALMNLLQVDVKANE